MHSLDRETEKERDSLEQNLRQQPTIKHILFFLGFLKHSLMIFILFIIVALQCSVNFYHTARNLSHIYIFFFSHIHIFAAQDAPKWVNIDYKESHTS